MTQCLPHRIHRSKKGQLHVVQLEFVLEKKKIPHRGKKNGTTGEGEVDGTEERKKAA